MVGRWTRRRQQKTTGQVGSGLSGDSQIRLRPKDTDQRPNLLQISQIWENKSTLKNTSTNPNTSSPQIRRTQTEIERHDNRFEEIETQIQVAHMQETKTKK